MKSGVETWRHQIREKLSCSVGAGSAAMLLIIPVLVVLVELAVLGGRIAGAQGELQSTARQAAREASLAKGPTTASGAASSVANASLQNTTFTCNTPSVVTDATGYVAGGKVTVTVRCLVDLSDLSNLPIPGVKTIAESASEPIDPYRVIE